MLIFEYDKEFCKSSLLTEEDLGRLHVQSSNIKSFWFKDAGRVKGVGILYVEFLSGAVYEFHRVPQNVVEVFTRSASYGQAFWRLIRGKYPYQRIK